MLYFESLEKECFEVFFFLCQKPLIRISLFQKNLMVSHAPA